MIDIRQHWFRFLAVWVVFLLWGCSYADNVYSDSREHVVLLIGTIDGNIHAFDEQLQKIWSASSGLPLMSTTVTPRSSAIPTIDGGVLISGPDGFRRTSHTAKTLVESSPFITNDGLLFSGRKDSRLFGVDIEDGTVIDEFSVGSKDTYNKLPGLPRSNSAPLWLGRTDYSLRAVDGRSGQVEFAFSFSELNPILERRSSELLDSNRVPSVRPTPQRSAGSELPLHDRAASVVSSLQGKVLLMDVSGEPVHELPIDLGSPAANAFVLRMEDGDPVVERALPVAHTIGDYRWRNRLIGKKKTISDNADQKSVIVVDSPSARPQSDIKSSYAMELRHLSQSWDHLFYPKHLTEGEPLDLQGDGRLFDTGHESHVGKQLLAISKLPATKVRAPSQSLKQIGIAGDLIQWPSGVVPGNGENMFQIFEANLDESLWSPSLDDGKQVVTASRPRPLQFGGSASSWLNYEWITIGAAIAIMLLLRLLSHPKEHHRSNEDGTGAERVEAPLSPPESLAGSRAERVGALLISDNILGYGSHGTVVFLGTLNGRPIAVKRIMSHFIKIAEREIALLIRSDGHPNVVRYFLKEQQGEFVYLGLQLCQMSLKDFVKALPGPLSASKISDAVRQCLLQVAEGLAHLHSLRIVHRDIKPHNILLSSTCEYPGMNNNEDDSASQGDASGPQSLETLGNYILKISDMGLARQLHRGEGTFSAESSNWLITKRSAAQPSSKDNQGDEAAMGTIGWQAPELISTESISAKDSHLFDHIQETDSEPIEEPQRRTLSVDVFSLGCVLYYALTAGSHPFGEWYERESNILAGKCKLDRLSHQPDATDLIASMLHSSPTQRPSSAQVCSHPFFWSSTKRLEFILELSDRLEKESADSQLALAIEMDAKTVIGHRWDSRLDAALLQDVGKYRKYDVTAVRDLLRIIRNKRHHFHDLSEDLQRAIGPIPEGFWGYFNARYPNLLLHCCRVVRGLYGSGIGVSGGTGMGQSAPAEETSDAALTTESAGFDVVLKTSPEDADKSAQPQPQVILWQGSALSQSFACRGWWRDASHWTDATSTVKKGKGSHFTKALADPKYRTRLCTHWEGSGGAQCSMRKKGKCIFAHTPLELRAKDSRRDRWGRGPPTYEGHPSWNTASGGEDVLSSARSSDKIRERAADWECASPGGPLPMPPGYGPYIYSAVYHEGT